MGKTFWPTNKGCEFCDQTGAHSSCESCENLGEKSCWIFNFSVAIPLLFTWCYESFSGGYTLVLDDYKLQGAFQKTL